MTECVLIKGFKQSLSLTDPVSLTSGCEAGCQKLCTLTAARPGWVTSNEISGNSLPSSASSCITSSLPFICLRDWPHFAAQRTVMKDYAENSALISSSSRDASSEPVPSTSSERLMMSCLLKKVNKVKPARSLPVPAIGWDLTRHCWKNVQCQEGSLSSRRLKVVLLSVGLVQNFAAGTGGGISARECRI